MSDDKAQPSGPEADKSTGDVQPAAADSEQIKAEAASQAGEPNAEPKAETKAEEKTETRTEPSAGKVMVMSPRDHGWRDDKIDSDPAFRDKAQAPKRERRFAAYAAVALLALFAGAAGGAMATMAVGKSGASAANTQAATDDKAARDQTIGRLETEVAALRASLEHAGKSSASQAAKLNDRIDRVEKAQAEPNAKIAKLNDAVEKLRAAPTAAATAAPAQIAAAQPSAMPSRTQATTPQTAATPPREATGSVQANANAGASPSAAPKPEVARLPTVEGWVLRDVSDGGALIENRRGTYEVYAGDEIRGLGRVDAIRKQDGRWVVVTSKGLIVSR